MKAFYSNARKRKASTFAPWQPAALPQRMNLMRRSSWLLWAGLGLALFPLRAETLDEAVRAMTNAEKKFCETGQEKGTRAAFLEFLAPDGIRFRARPGEWTGSLEQTAGNRARSGLGTDLCRDRS
jgi:hypothetical protein